MPSSSVGSLSFSGESQEMEMRLVEMKIEMVGVEMEMMKVCF